MNENTPLTNSVDAYMTFNNTNQKSKSDFFPYLRESLQPQSSRSSNTTLDLQNYQHFVNGNINNEAYDQNDNIDNNINNINGSSLASPTHNKYNNMNSMNEFSMFGMASSTSTAPSSSSISSTSSSNSSPFQFDKRHNSSPLIGSKFFNPSNNPPHTMPHSVSSASSVLDSPNNHLLSSPQVRRDRQPIQSHSRLSLPNTSSSYTPLESQINPRVGLNMLGVDFFEYEMTKNIDDFNQLTIDNTLPLISSAPAMTSSGTTSQNLYSDQNQIHNQNLSQGPLSTGFVSPESSMSGFQSIWSNNATPNFNNNLNLNDHWNYASETNDSTPKMDQFAFCQTNESNSYSPLLSMESPSMINSTHMIDHPYSPEIKKQSANFYLSKVNIPSFIPSQQLNHEIVDKCEQSTLIPEITEEEYALDHTRYILKHGENNEPYSNHTHAQDEKRTLNQRIENLNERTKKLKNDKQTIPEANKVDKISVNLPKNYSNSSATNMSNVNLSNCSKNFDKSLLDQITSSSIKYEEDYCSTFYKRNKHRYMFIKELGNSLKVNTSGGKSWVTIKLKLGDSNDRQLKKTLKVDIKDLPIWKPINVSQSHTTNHTSYDQNRSKSSAKNKLNGSKVKSSNYNFDFDNNDSSDRKFKNLNVLKRFGGKRVV